MELKDGLLHPKHPERICWGCDKYCRANDLCCREERVPHPSEPFGGAGDPAALALEPVAGVVIRILDDPPGPPFIPSVVVCRKEIAGEGHSASVGAEPNTFSV